MAADTQANLTYIDRKVRHFAPVLNAPTLGICSMQVLDYVTGARSVVGSCSNGILSMTTANDAVPGMAMVKQLGKITYLLAQSDRRSPNGASFTYALSGLAGKTAKIVYDSTSITTERIAHARRFSVSMRQDIQRCAW